MGPIVVAYDGTPGARAALREADRLAGELRTSIVVVFCAHVSRIGGEVHDYEEALREHGRAQLEDARSQLEHAVGETQLVLVEAEPAEGLIEVADEHDARLIAIGSYGERPIKSVLVGSTPTRLMHLSARPVLVVRATE